MCLEEAHYTFLLSHSFIEKIYTVLTHMDLPRNRWHPSLILATSSFLKKKTHKERKSDKMSEETSDCRYLTEWQRKREKWGLNEQGKHTF